MLLILYVMSDVVLCDNYIYIYIFFSQFFFKFCNSSFYVKVTDCYQSAVMFIVTAFISVYNYPMNLLMVIGPSGCFHIIHVYFVFCSLWLLIVLFVL